VDEVRRLRLQKGWSQNELAYHAKLAPSVISLIETGKREPNATTLRKLANALEVRIPDLFEESGPGKAQSPLPEAEQRVARQHEGLVGSHESAARLGRNVAASFANFRKADLERLAIFHDLYASLAKMRGGRDIWGRDPEDLAEATDRLEAAANLVETALQEHLDLVPQETRLALDELLKDRAGA
jgi:transcriptional regulator with XRE-family HTH domain